jgi:hypothetical protein
MDEKGSKREKNKGEIGSSAAPLFTGIIDEG